MRSARVSAFESAIRNFVLSTAFREAVLAEKPALATNIRDLSDRLKADFPQPPEITVADSSSTVRRALLLNRKELPLTLVVLDEGSESAIRASGIAFTLAPVVEWLQRGQWRMTFVSSSTSRLEPYHHRS